MLSKAKIKLIQSLELKKKRREERLFVAEGPKVVGDLLPYFTCRLIVASNSWLEQHPHIKADEVIEATTDELRKASFLKAPQDVLALFELPDYPTPDNISYKELCLALDDIQDPGNLGTIIRVADWFGIRHIFCSIGTTDAYSPKLMRYPAVPQIDARAVTNEPPFFNYTLKLKNLFALSKLMPLTISPSASIS